jgi:hypothetical protein
VSVDIARRAQNVAQALAEVVEGSEADLRTAQVELLRGALRIYRDDLTPEARSLLESYLRDVEAGIDPRWTDAVIRAVWDLAEQRETFSLDAVRALLERRRVEPNGDDALKSVMARLCGSLVESDGSTVQSSRGGDAPVYRSRVKR